MSDPNTRVEHESTRGARSLSYAELRELALERRAAKQGVSRRDFVRAGTAAAIVAATSREAAARQTKPRDAFDLCMKALMEGAGKWPLSPAAEQGLAKYGPAKFVDGNMPIWEANKEKILTASRAIGALAAVLAEGKAIDYGDIKKAVSIVKGYCDVRKDREDVRLRFCPDLP